VPGDDGELVHPLDVREFGAEPAWGPWELLGEPEAESPAPPPEPALAPFSAPPVTPEGM
jgi:hypothetical protein